MLSDFFSLVLTTIKKNLTLINDKFMDIAISHRRKFALAKSNSVVND